MQNETLLFLAIAIAVSFAIAYYFYAFRSQLNRRLRWLFGILRFFSVFLLLLLLINPIISNYTYETVKPTLVVAIDNSKSISYLNEEKSSIQWLADLQNNETLNKRFEIAYYTFGDDLQVLDSLTFSENHSRISEALYGLNEVYKNTIAPIVLATDGNQTLGADYQYLKDRLQQPVYPLVLGDTLQHSDLYISQINVNRYAYLKNDFPVEVFVGYTGTEPVNREFTIMQGHTVVYKEILDFTLEKNTHAVRFNLTANHTGVLQYSAGIHPLPNEKNTENNTRYFAVEVVDQATQILLVSDLVHPDIGMLQKSITSNEQRQVFITKPEEALKHIDEAQLLILYQPNSKFQPIFEYLNNHRLNTWIITGIHTDWRYLNGAQSYFKKNAYNNESVQAVFNSAYGIFSTEDIGFSGFPPLETSLGTLNFSVPREVLLEQKILSVVTGSPLAATFEVDGVKMGVFDAEGWWRWRAASYVKSKNFQSFDNFISGVVQYLASTKKRNRLEVHSEAFYYNNRNITISAQYFDANYVFNNSASLTISIKNKDIGVDYTYPLLIKNNYYEVNLSNLPAGEYSYTVRVSGENLSKSGQFQIVAFDVEQQFVNADVKRLRHLSAGNLYFADKTALLLEDLMNNEEFTPTQKSINKKEPLADWKVLLFLMVGLLATEWFLRKYHGLV